MKAHSWSRALAWGAVASALVAVISACAPIAANPTPNPATLGFEALPPPTEEPSPLLASSSEAVGTSIVLASGEECIFIGAEPLEVGGEPIAYHCILWHEEPNTFVALGALASVQGLSFQSQRIVAGQVDGRLQVISSTPFPFTILQVVLEDGTVCTSVGEGTNAIIDNARISFRCAAPSDGDPAAGIDTSLVLLNGLYPEEDGAFTVDAATLSGDFTSGTLSNPKRLSAASLLAQPLIVSVTAEESGKTIYISPAQILEVILPSNATTGYSWILAEDSAAPLSLAAEPEYVAPANPMPGTGGAEVLRFDVADFGSGQLLLQYVRPFEDDREPADTFELAVTIAATLAENGASVTLPVGEALAVDLPGNPNTGHQWQVVGNDGQILAQTSDAVTVSPLGFPSAGGVQRFAFEGVARGTMTLTIHDVRPLDPEGVPASTFALEVTVE